MRRAGYASWERAGADRASNPKKKLDPPEMPTTVLSVTSASDLDAAIATVNNASSGDSYSIVFTGNIIASSD